MSASNQQHDDLIFTDAWHPTVNPSSRLPIHHYRFHELLGTNTGVLDELPRANGGSTIRVIRIRADRTFDIQSLASGPKWMPWWSSARSALARSIMDEIFNNATNNNVVNEVERGQIHRLREEYGRSCDKDPDLTFGEALNIATESLLRTYVPNAPKVSLTSLTHSPMRFVLAGAATLLSSDLRQLLASWAAQSGRSHFGQLGIITELGGRSWQLRFDAETEKLSAIAIRYLGQPPLEPKTIDAHELVDLLARGLFLPSSRLQALWEAALVVNGESVTHYGNTYGRTQEALRLLGETNVDRLTLWADDEDSWHFAVLVDSGGTEYPIHVLDALTLSDRGRAGIPALINESLLIGGPVRLSIQEGGVDASIPH